MRRLIALLLVLILLPVLPALAEDVPYRQKIVRPDEMIFSGPSYDEFCVGTVREAGVYTIVEESDDGEGHLWGRLKSGAGWIDLTHVRDEAIAAWPVSAAFAEDCPPTGSWRRFAAEEGEFTTWIAFRAYAPMRNVSLVSIDMGAEEGFAVGETLCILPELTPDTPLVAGVVFYGDMTAYGLRFTDEAGQICLFQVSISGRNGMLILEELPLPDGASAPIEEIPLP